MDSGCASTGHAALGGATAWGPLRRLLEVGQVDPGRRRPAVAGIDLAAVPAFKDRMPGDHLPVFEDPHFR